MSMSHNHGDVGLQLNEDNALVASDDKDDTSQGSFLALFYAFFQRTVTKMRHITYFK